MGEPAAVVAGTVPSEVVDVDDLDALSWAHVTGRFVALGHDFAVRTSDPAMGRYLEQMLDPFAAPGRPARYYSVLDRGEAETPRFVVYLGERRVEATSDAELLFRRILWQVNHHVAQETATHVLVHASAAEHEGRAIIFPAPMESGKSTLVAGLVAAGLRYLTDEAAAVDPRTGLVVPYPRAIALDEGSWPVLPELRPRVAPEHERFIRMQWHVDARTIRPDAFAPASPPAFVVPIRFEQGAATRMEPISRAEALVALAENCYNLSVHGADGFHALAEVARRSTCRRLVIGALAPAVDAVRSLVAAAP